MPYIGNPIYQSAFVTDQFSGDGSTTAFTMSVAPAGVTNVLVAVSGVLQDPSTYGVTGTTITFSTAPPSGTGNISCRYLGIPVTGIVTTAYRTVTEFTATASQTTFTPPSYTVGYINVYRNGVLLGSADYTATNGTTVVLASGATAGDIVTVESFRVESVLNAISNSAGSVGTTNIANGAVTTAKLASTTGSGAVVLATSPTLVTPALGTPSALVLTNATGLPASALPTGSIRQVVSTTYSSSVATTNTSMTDSGISASITPASSTNKILVMITVPFLKQQGGGSGSPSGSGIAIYNGSGTLLYDAMRDGGGVLDAWTETSGSTVMGVVVSKQFLHSPGTTSSYTYKIYFAQRNGGTITINWQSSSYVTITLLEVVA